MYVRKPRNLGQSDTDQPPADDLNLNLDTSGLDSGGASLQQANAAGALTDATGLIAGAFGVPTASSTAAATGTLPTSTPATDKGSFPWLLVLGGAAAMFYLTK